MYRVVMLRRHGRRDDRSALQRDPGLVGMVDIYSMSVGGGVTTRYLRLSAPKHLSSSGEVLGLLEAPEFQTFTGDVFLVKGIETDDKGRQFVQEWWGRRVDKS